MFAALSRLSGNKRNLATPIAPLQKETAAPPAQPLPPLPSSPREGDYTVAPPASRELSVEERLNPILKFLKENGGSYTAEQLDERLNIPIKHSEELLEALENSFGVHVKSNYRGKKEYSYSESFSVAPSGGRRKSSRRKSKKNRKRRKHTRRH